jgi:hypothetical protein
MSIKVAPETVITDVDAGIRVWKANPEVRLKDLTFEQYQADRAKLVSLMQKSAELDEQLTQVNNDRDKLALDLHANNSRLRSAARGYFGPDSTEYEQLGGTRTSDRKKPSRKKETALAAK